jgi:hypothetical protein
MVFAGVDPGFLSYYVAAKTDIFDFLEPKITTASNFARNLPSVRRNKIVSENQVFVADMVYPPIFQEVHERIGVLVQNAAPADVRQLERQNVVQFMVFFGVGKINPFKKGFLYAKVDARVVVHHIDDGGKHILGIAVLHYEMQRIDGRDYSPVLFIDDGYAQIVVRLPDDKDVVLRQVRTGSAFLFFVAHTALLCFRFSDIEFSRLICYKLYSAPGAAQFFN